MKMVQIIDVSKSVLYDKEKNLTDMLQVINATVSHELRNPLNSLIAQNLEKSYLYEELIEIIETIPEMKQKQQLKEILEKLKQGNKIQK